MGDPTSDRRDDFLSPPAATQDEHTEGTGVGGEQPHPESPAEEPPLASQHTSTFAEFLEEFGISVLVTTYQAGRLVMLRADHGCVNTHFRRFAQPMGLAVEGGRLAVGTKCEIWEFHNAPAVAPRLEPPGRCDACFLPRGSHTTGEISIHEMAWAEGELWFVNTRFSCLSTRDLRYSFVPRWRPPFISALAPEDRCHLNGLCLAPPLTPASPGRAAGPRWFVSGLGETDTPGGWRSNKRDGGLVLETGHDQVVARGLSMPHSPRWHDNRLWLLESGRGALGAVDLQTGRYESIAELPGFTRGLDFFGRYAVVGLSQVRETAIFGGLPITERAERSCGVWIVDIVTGRTVAWLKFADTGVREIFAVHVLHGSRYPDLVNDDAKRIEESFVLPDEALNDVPAPLRALSN